MIKHRKGWSGKRKAGTEVWFGRASTDIPSQEVGDLSPDIFASYSGPDRGLSIVLELEPLDNTENKDANSNSHPGSDHSSLERSAPSRPVPRTCSDCAGSRQWNVKSRKAYGICMSLYEQHPINGKISGDPIADAFGVCARTNNSVMIVADGVNWGEKSKLAARCAIYGSMNHINKRLFTGTPITNTHEAFRVLLSAVDEAHNAIIRYGGGQTTLCMALILPIRDSKQFVVCIVNVGDSLAYVFSKFHGIREITTGSHDIQTERDIRDAGGAVGPVHGNDPELHNLTCSMTVVDPGDIVYLTTDGISDNFDPVVTKIAVAKQRRHSNPELQTLPEDGGVENQNGNMAHAEVITCGTLDGKPVMEPHERHQYAVKEMERIIHEFELFTEQPCSAQELCGALLQHVLKLTDPKRKVLENPDLYGKKLKSKDRKRRDSEIIAKLSKSPGKLDHATIIGYDVGVYHGNDDEDYEMEDISEDEEVEEEEEDLENNLSPTEITVRDIIIDNTELVSSPKSPHGRNKASWPRSHSPDKRHAKHSESDACDSKHDTSEHSATNKQAKSLKNLKLKIRTRFKSPGRKSTSERSPEKSPKSAKSPRTPKTPKSPPSAKSPQSLPQYSPDGQVQSPRAEQEVDLSDVLIKPAIGPSNYNFENRPVGTSPTRPYSPADHRVSSAQVGLHMVQGYRVQHAVHNVQGSVHNAQGGGPRPQPRTNPHYALRKSPAARSTPGPPIQVAGCYQGPTHQFMSTPSHHAIKSENQNRSRYPVNEIPVQNQPESEKRGRSRVKSCGPYHSPPAAVSESPASPVMQFFQPVLTSTLKQVQSPLLKDQLVTRRSHRPEPLNIPKPARPSSVDLQSPLIIYTRSPTRPTIEPVFDSNREKLKPKKKERSSTHSSDKGPVSSPSESLMPTKVSAPKYGHFQAGSSPGKPLSPPFFPSPTPSLPTSPVSSGQGTPSRPTSVASSPSRKQVIADYNFETAM